MKTSYELFGVECGAGWRNLIEPLIEKCNEQGVNILQVKEKYGGLRFYVAGCSDELHDAIDSAEALSYKICELCGNPGTLMGHGWLKTRCDKCAEL